MSKLSSMRYKGYTWKYNPSRCTYTCEKSIVKHKYPELSGSDLEDLDPNAAIIVGSGEFFGESAYDEWVKLNKVFRERGPGQFYHPIFKDVTMAAFYKLEASVEPRENYVAYSFEFWEHTPTVIKAVQSVAKQATPTATAQQPTTYTVVSGDTLWGIAAKKLGNGTKWQDIAKYNSLKNPHLIFPGQIIKIPPKG